jgi:hypothetical protein
MSFPVFSINKDTLNCDDVVYAKNIKTVRMHQYDLELSYPVMGLHSLNPLLFSFDQLESEPLDYYYTIIHCTHDWKPSNLMFFEYADGFEENKIRDYSNSHSTFVPYTHYQLEIPNEDISLNFSGNYLLIVYTKDRNKETIVCTKRFMLFEQLVEVEGRVNASPDNMHRKTSQKVDFRINRNGYEIYDPDTELKIAVLQNYQWNNAILNVRHTFMDNQYFVYESDDAVLFPASNEYRFFNIINLNFEGENVARIEFKRPYYYVELIQDKSKLFTLYSNYTDLNGHFAIRTDRYKNKDFPEVQSDYVIVRFRLNYNIPLNNADIYLYGELTNYELNDNYKMLYNLETRCYEKLLLLKQGYYNYRYITVSQDASKTADHTFFEGSYFDTENDYLILVYHRNPRKTYDELINFTILNSRMQ